MAMRATVSALGRRGSTRPRADTVSSDESAPSLSSSSSTSSGESSSYRSRTNPGMSSSPLDRRGRAGAAGVPSRRLSHDERAARQAHVARAKRDRGECRERRQAAHDSQMRALYTSEYRDEILDYMFEMEGQTMAQVELIDQQPELEWYMRPYLIEFLIEIHQQYRLRQETLFLAINIVDRYVAKRIVYKKHYQLVGCAALWIASKFEDAKDRVPGVADLTQVCCGAYDAGGFIQMEGHVLATIGWNLGHPTVESWLRLACYPSVTRPMEDSRIQHCARMFTELTLFHRSFVSVKPSHIAQGCLMLARHICHGLSHTSASEHDQVEAVRVAGEIDQYLTEHLEQVSATVMKKYAPSFYDRISDRVREYYLNGGRFRYRQVATRESLEAPCITVTAPSTPIGPCSEADSDEEIDIDMNTSSDSAGSSRNGMDSSEDSIFDHDYSHSSGSMPSSEPITPASSTSGYSDRIDMYDSAEQACAAAICPPPAAVRAPVPALQRRATLSQNEGPSKDLIEQLAVLHRQQAAPIVTVNGPASQSSWQMQVIPQPAETHH